MKWRALIFLLTIPAFCLGFGDAVREQSLGEAAEASGMLIGTAVRPAQLSEVAYASTLAREFNMLEPEDVAGAVLLACKQSAGSRIIEIQMRTMAEPLA